MAEKAKQKDARDLIWKLFKAKFFSFPRDGKTSRRLYKLYGSCYEIQQQETLSLSQWMIFSGS